MSRRHASCLPEGPGDRTSPTYYEGATNEEEVNVWSDLGRHHRPGVRDRSRCRGERMGSYLALKGGIYSPSATFDLSNVDVETTFDGDTETGRRRRDRVRPLLPAHLRSRTGRRLLQGQGLLRDRLDAGQGRLQRHPDHPVRQGPHPRRPGRSLRRVRHRRLLLGIQRDDNLNTFDGTTTFGIHAGAGLNVDITQSAFIGVEGRYVWANPSFGDQTIRLNDDRLRPERLQVERFHHDPGPGLLLLNGSVPQWRRNP